MISVLNRENIKPFTLLILVMVFFPIHRLRQLR